MKVTESPGLIQVLNQNECDMQFIVVFLQIFSYIQNLPVQTL